MKKTQEKAIALTLPADKEVTSDLLLRRRKNPLWERITGVYVIFVLVVFPFLYDKYRYTKITAAKFNWFWTTAAIFLVVCALCAFKLLDAKWRRIRLLEKPALPTWPQYLLAGYMLWACFSALCSDYRSQAWLGTGGRFEGLFSILMYGAVFLMVARFGEFSKSIVYGIAAMALVFSFICTLQTWGAPILYPTSASSPVNYWNSNFLGTVGNIDMVAAIIAMTVPLLFCASVLLDDKKRWLCLPGMALMLYIQLFSDVDSSKIGILLAMAFALPFLTDTQERLARTALAFAVCLGTVGLTDWFHCTQNGWIIHLGKKSLLMLIGAVVLAAFWYLVSHRVIGQIKFFPSPRKMRIIVVIAEAVLLVVMLLFLYNYKGGNTLLYQAGEILHGRFADNAGSARGAIWKCSFHIMLEHPILGGGPGSLCALFRPYNEYYSTSVGSYCEVDFAHNEFLQIGVCVGIVGLLIYVAFIVMLAVRALKVAHRCPLVVILAAGVAGYIGHSLFSFSLAMVTPLYWVLAGLLDKCVSQVPPVAAEEPAGDK